MTIDLDTPEAKEAIKAAVDEEVLRLKTHNDKLILENRKLSKLKEVDPEEHARLKEDIQELTDKAANADKARAKAEKDLKAAQDSTAAEQLANHTLLVDRGISDALIKAGVKKEYMDFVKAKYLTQAKVVEADGARKGQIGDKDIDAFFGEWAKGEEAKHFIGAPANNGGGATGGGGGAGTGKTYTQAQINAMAPKERFAAMTQPGVTVTE